MINDNFNTTNTQKINSSQRDKSYKKFYYFAFLMPILFPLLLILGVYISQTLNIPIRDIFNKYLINSGIIIIFSLAFGWVQYLFYLVFALSWIMLSNTKKQLFLLIYISPFIFSLIGPLFIGFSRFHNLMFNSEFFIYALCVSYGYVIFTEVTYYLLQKKL